MMQWLKDATGSSGVQLLVHKISHIGPRDSTVFQKFLNRSIGSSHRFFNHWGYHNVHIYTSSEMFEVCLALQKQFRIFDIYGFAF